MAWTSAQTFNQYWRGQRSIWAEGLRGGGNVDAGLEGDGGKSSPGSGWAEYGLGQATVADGVRLIAGGIENVLQRFRLQARRCCSLFVADLPKFIIISSAACMHPVCRMRELALPGVFFTGHSGACATR